MSDYIPVREAEAVVKTDSDLQQELEDACMYGDLRDVENLITRGCDPHAKTFGIFKGTLLHEACSWGHLDVVRYLIEDQHCDVNSSTKDGSYTPLHMSCLRGHLDVVRYLIEDQHCDVNSTTRTGSYTLHYSCLYGHLPVVRYLLEDRQCDVNVTDNYGQTSLHIVCQSTSSSLETLEYLLKNQKMDPNQTTILGKSSLQLVVENSFSFFKAKKQSAVRLLLAYGAKPPYETWSQYLKVDGPQKPAEAYSKLFLMGDPGGGKSTLAKSLETEAEGFDRFLNRLRKVANVDAKTAGIVTKDIISKSLGRVTVYDLAGHSEFYASHDTALRNALAGSPSSIIVLVADMRGGGKSFETAFLKWCSFAENLYEESADNLPFLIIVGSHEDSTSKANTLACGQVISGLQESSSLISFCFKGFVPLDCRYSVSSHMEELRAILKDCSQVLKQEELLSFREHCFLVFLLDMYRDFPAVTVKEITAKILETASGSTSASSFLPTDASTMAEICTQMNKRGNILYLHNTECPGDSWIVLQKDVLLEKVNGSIFAPKCFKEHTAVATDTGIVPVSKLVAQFPDIAHNLIVCFMCHLQFCLEVTDVEILQQLSISGDHPEHERFLFFPSLVTTKVPVGVWESSVSFTYQSAWVLECRKAGFFFSSRLLHMIIHRLAFSFAMAADTTSDQLSIHRRCSVWKEGIFWITLDGVNVLVEVSNSNRLTLLVGARKDCELDAVNLRSKVISTVLQAKKDFCPKLDVSEFFIKNDSISYPLKNDAEAIQISDISKSIVNCQAYCYCKFNPSSVIEVATLLHFEPFVDLGGPIINDLFTKGQSELTDEFLAQISVQLHNKSQMFIDVLGMHHFFVDFELNKAPKGAVISNKLLHALQLWRNKEHSYSSLCRRLSEYSVFAGRNPLMLAGVSPKNFSPESVKPFSLPIHTGQPTRHSLTIEDLMRRTGVSSTQLNMEITAYDLHILAECFGNVEDYLDKLSLNEGQQTDIKDIAYQRSTKTAMVKALKLWHQPNPFAATVQALLEILLDLKRGDVAVKVCRCVIDNAARE